MLKINFAEVIFRLMPEVYAVLYLIYCLMREKFDAKKNIFVVVVISICIYLIRLLPIFYGMHIVINCILFVCVLVFLKVPLIKSINNTIIAFFILSICEFINLLIVQIIRPGQGYVNFTKNFVSKDIGTMPSIIAIYIIAEIIQHFHKRREKRDVINREDSMFDCK